MKRLLVVSGDASWIEYLKIELDAFGIVVDGTRAKASLKERQDALTAALQNDPPDAILVSDLAAAGQTQSDALLDAITILGLVRDLGIKVRVLLWSIYPSERIAGLKLICPDTVLLPNDALETIADNVMNASKHQGVGPGAARIEVLIGATNIRTEIILDGKPVVVPSSRDWARRPKMEQLEEAFLTWSPLKHDGSKIRYTDNWEVVLRMAGEDIFYETDYAGKLVSEATAYCLEQLGTLDRIHVRFNLMSPGAGLRNPFVHVPFEVLYDKSKKDFVRRMAPIARRDCLSASSRTAMPLPMLGPLTGHALFIRSDATGKYDFPGASPMFNSLRALDIEYKAFATARSNRNLAPPEKLALTVGGNALQELQQRLNAPMPGQTIPLQIIHFAGHSIQIDDGSVYLILPGPVAGRVSPLRMSEFAAWCANAGAQVIILSSCESSGPEAVFRLAQAGIPAVIGFRWEVNDEEAAFFTAELHSKLCDGVPLARAFHSAVKAVSTQHQKSPTFVSPMLVVQHEEWTTI